MKDQYQIDLSDSFWLIMKNKINHFKILYIFTDLKIHCVKSHIQSCLRVFKGNVTYIANLKLLCVYHVWYYVEKKCLSMLSTMGSKIFSSKFKLSTVAQRKMNPQKPKPKNLKTLFCIFVSQKMNIFKCRNKILILWHPWDPWGPVYIDLKK